MIEVREKKTLQFGGRMYSNLEIMKHLPFRREAKLKLIILKWVDNRNMLLKLGKAFPINNILEQKWLLLKFVSLPSLKIFKWIRYSFGENLLEF